MANIAILKPEKIQDGCHYTLADIAQIIILLLSLLVETHQKLILVFRYSANVYWMRFVYITDDPWNSDEFWYCTSNCSLMPDHYSRMSSTSN